MIWSCCLTWFTPLFLPLELGSTGSGYPVRVTGLTPLVDLGRKTPGFRLISSLFITQASLFFFGCYLSEALPFFSSSCKCFGDRSALGGKPAELGLSTHLLPGVEQAHTDDGTSSSELSKALPCKWYRSHSNMVKRRRRKSGVKERGSMLTHKFLGGSPTSRCVHTLSWQAWVCMYHL